MSRAKVEAYVPPPLKDKAKELCRAQHTTLSARITDLLYLYVKNPDLFTPNIEPRQTPKP
jgi:hypothetical protein